MREQTTKNYLTYAMVVRHAILIVVECRLVPSILTISASFILVRRSYAYFVGATIRIEVFVYSLLDIIVVPLLTLVIPYMAVRVSYLDSLYCFISRYARQVYQHVDLVIVGLEGHRRKHLLRAIRAFTALYLCDRYDFLRIIWRSRLFVIVK